MNRRCLNSSVAVFWLLMCAGGIGCASSSEEGGIATGDSPDAVEAISLLGRRLHQISFSVEEQERLEKDLREAQINFEADRNHPDNWIWLGRRLAYLWRYKDAVEVFSEALEKFPKEPRLYRHRGHRYITLRQFDLAVADLSQAAELTRGKPDRVEPDGAPNSQNRPRSTLQSNIWYHLGLAHYLKGEFEDARLAYEEGMKVSNNDDMLVATTDWLYMTYRRLGEEDLAVQVVEPIVPDMEILENASYHQRILMYKGALKPAEILDSTNASELDIATQGYGIGNWYLYNGETDRAEETFRQVVNGSYWSAFGYIAAEADLSRMPSRKAQ